MVAWRSTSSRIMPESRDKLWPDWPLGSYTAFTPFFKNVYCTVNRLHTVSVRLHSVSLHTRRLREAFSDLTFPGTTFAHIGDPLTVTVRKIRLKVNNLNAWARKKQSWISFPTSTLLIRIGVWAASLILTLRVGLYNYFGWAHVSEVGVFSCKQLYA